LSYENIVDEDLSLRLVDLDHAERVFELIGLRFGLPVKIEKAGLFRRDWALFVKGK
jgi:hypothetical protein